MTRPALAVLAVVTVTLGACAGDDPAVTSFTATIGEATSTTASTSGSTAVESTSTSTTTTSDASGDPSTTASTGVAERCGDGVLQDDEECDDGPANDDAAACTESCAVNVCGDGLVLEGVELLNIRSYAPLRAILGHFSTSDPDSIQIRSEFWRSLPLVHPPRHANDHSAGRPSDLRLTKAGGPSIAA